MHYRNTRQHAQRIKDAGSRRILVAAFSHDGAMFVTVDDLKTMTLFTTDGWQCLNSRYLVMQFVSNYGLCISTDMMIWIYYSIS